MPPLLISSVRAAALPAALLKSMLNVYTNPVFYEHNTGVGHPESATRLDAALAGVERAGLAEKITRETAEHPDTNRIIAKVHSADYERSLEEASRSGMRLFHSLDNPISTQTFAAARTAVGVSLTAAENLMRGDANRAFVIARPPGPSRRAPGGHGLLLLQHHRLRR